MKNKKMILILVLLLVIGFASISTTLVITGVIGISNNKDDFKVIFTNAKLDGVEKKEFIDSTTKQTINYETNKLTTINETTTLEYEVTNTSRIYDAEVRIGCNIVDDSGNPTTSEYISMEYTPNNMTVHAGESKSGSITTKLIKSSTEDKSIKVKCELNANATEREELGSEYQEPLNVTLNANGGNVLDSNYEIEYGKSYGNLPTPTKEHFEFLGWYNKDRVKVEPTTFVNINENHTLTAGWKDLNLTSYELIYDNDLDGVADEGDEIKVGTESFYVISHTATELNGLAKYNLKAGHIFSEDGNTDEGVISSTEEGYGIQNEQMKGLVYGEKRYGTLRFSKQNGWPYDNNDTIDIRNEKYRNATDISALDVLYGENGYEKYIQNILSVATIRLITKGEIENLVNNGSEISWNLKEKADAKGYQWLYSTTYWTGSAYHYFSGHVYCVLSDGIFYGVTFSDYGNEYGDYDNFTSYGPGVRPVITIPLS